MFQNILVSFDGSDQARSAAILAAGLARLQKEPFLTVACVMEYPNEAFQEPFQSQVIADRSIRGNNLLDEAARLIGEDIPIRRELLFGDPARSIIDVAEARKCDLIVMGTRGLGPLTGLLLGSKAQKVVSLANCPVLLTR